MLHNLLLVYIGGFITFFLSGLFDLRDMLDDDYVEQTLKNVKAVKDKASELPKVVYAIVAFLFMIVISIFYPWSVSKRIFKSDKKKDTKEIK